MTSEARTPKLPSDPEQIRTWIVRRLAERSGLDPRAIDSNEQFSRYGLDSVGATSMLEELGALLGRRLPSTLVWRYPTVDTMVRYLTTGASAPASRSSVFSAHPSGKPLRRVQDEPIAIIGLACRFPKAPSPGAFWRLLRDGVDAVTEVPRDRWDVDALYDPDTAAPGKMSTRWGGFLDHVDRFDARFFDISPREAIPMDPQQRLMLELAWEALEDAGVPPRGLKGSRTGVFCGAMWVDYTRGSRGELESIVQHSATGQDLSIIPARISYTLGLQGPSLAVDTACSSALVAIHLACQSLLRGESRLALAGGVSLMLSPDITVAMSKFGGMSPDGRCKAFDARANGYVRGEGGGVVVLKPLSRALADGDPIYCVIRGSAMNNDGPSNGLSAPNPKAQEAVLRDAYAWAGIDPADVNYVEAHGTGTFLGDPIEAKALGAILCAERPADRPLRVGSVKTNIGHLEPAAGVASIIKVALAMQHQALPPSLHCQSPNPNIPFDELRLEVQRSLEAWPDEGDGRVLAGVSSFGFGGTNCHVVLEGVRPVPAHLLPLSAPSAEALAALARQVREVAGAAGTALSLPALCSVAAARFSQHDHRLAMTLSSPDDLPRLVDSFLDGQPFPGVSSDLVAGARSKVVFLFGGHGSQWLGMGQDLLRAEPVFRSALARCDAAIRPHVAWSLLDVLTTGEARLLDQTEVIQPVIFAIQVALAALWRSWGIEPDAVVGQSIGEVAAAHVAGALDLNDAARVICRMAQVAGKVSGRGGAAVVDLPLQGAQSAIAGYAKRLCVSGSNSPTSTVLSGDTDALEEVLTRLQERAVLVRRIRMDYAPHSAQLESLGTDLWLAIEGVRPRPCATPFYSTVAGTLVDGAELDAMYWVRNLREPVLLSQAVERLIEDGHDTFLELDPHPVLAHAIEQTLAHAHRRGVVLPSLRRDEGARSLLLQTLGALYTRGQPIRWDRLTPSEPDAGLFPSLRPFDAPTQDETAHRALARGAAPPELFVLSARSGQALDDIARSVASWLREPHEHAVGDIAYTACVRRSHHEHRLALVGRSRAELAASLDAYGRGEDRPGMTRGQAPHGPRPKVVFVFPGHGSQWLGMGRELLRSEPVFRATIEACDKAISREAGFSLLEELTADEGRSRLGQIDVVQAALFAVAVGLSAVWRSWGVEPDAVVGHSMGEVAAAHVAGALTLEDAAAIICRRSQVLRRVGGQGGMALVELPMSRAADVLAGYEDRVSIAGSNSPRSTVLSGELSALEEILDRLEEAQVFFRRVKIDFASHSPQMDPLLDDLRTALRTIAPSKLTVPLCSTVTGQLVLGDELGAEYWLRNLRDPVLFSVAAERLLDGGHTLFVEMSAHPILVPPLEELVRERAPGGAALGSLRRGQDERQALLESVGALYARGYPIDFARLYTDGGRCVPLPTYRFQRERYWLEEGEPIAGNGVRQRALKGAAASRPLLGGAFRSSLHSGIRFWEQELAITSQPYLADHRVLGEAVLPGAAYVDMALSAAAEAYGAERVSLAHVEFQRVLLVPEDEPRAVQVVLVEEANRRVVFHVSSLEGQRWIRHAEGELLRGEGAGGQPERPGETPHQIKARCTTAMDAAEHYERMDAQGLSYGTCFRSVTAVWVGAGEALGRVEVPEEVSGSAATHALHPALLDGCFQLVCGLAASATTLHAGELPNVPAAIEQVRVHLRPGPGLWAHARLRPEGHGGAAGFVADLTLLEEDGRSVAEIEGLRLQRLSPAALGRRNPLDAWLYAVAWRRRDAAPALAKVARIPAAPKGAWLIFADRAGAGIELEALLRAQGEACVRVEVGDRYARVGPTSYSLDPEDIGGYRRLLDEALDVEGPCRGVIHLWSLDAATPERTTAETLRDDQRLGSLSALFLAQALLQKAWRDTPRLWLVTRGAQAAGTSTQPTAVAQSPLWGLGRTLVIEHSALACTCVDLDPSQAESVAASELLKELRATDDGEDQIALRADGRYVPRLVRGALDAGGVAPAGARIGAEGTYLITGGLGGLGLSIAAWLVARGARHLALLGRSGGADSARASVASLVEAGANVAVIRADISRVDDVERALAEVAASMPPIRGVVHAAGVLDDATALQLDAERMRRVMAPKVEGAWNLHTLLRDEPLDFFVLYSSAASLLGFAGQGNYAAANAFLDALAHHRRALGLPALSINWGPFSEVGLAAAQDNRGARLSVRGMGSLTPAQGVDALEALLAWRDSQVGVMDLDLRRWTEFYPSAARSTLWAELRKQREPEKAGSPEAARLRETLASSADRVRSLTKHLGELLGHVLRADASRIDPLATFVTLGMDSLMIVELRNRIESSLGLRLPATLLFTYPNLTSLTSHLLDELELPAAPEAKAPRAEKTEVAAPAAPTTPEAIAIVGMACRLPGGGDSPEAFWRALVAETDAVTEVPCERWPLPPLADGDSDPASRAVRWGAFLSQVDEFDPQFFGLSPREAVSLDPQQRLLLEVAWEALENAGIVPERLAGSLTGVFLGLMTQDYAQLSSTVDPASHDIYATTGNGHSFPAGRLSYTLGLQGPSLTVDTACSSSLVAIHLACQSLRSGESHLALAAGVNLMLSPLTMRLTAKTGALSPDGRCRTFDAHANGFVRGEGCGVVVLKRLSEARRDGDPILAVIRGSAINQDGRSTGLTAPNGLSQQAMLRSALDGAGVSASDVGYVEAHGTGTALGDPIEVEALASVLGRPRRDGSVCVLGSAKTNIGHLEAAAGVAGVIKTVLSLAHETIPPVLHFEALNPRISLEGTPFIIPRTALSWPTSEKPRIAGVSAFGMSGTNAHVLLEEAPRAPRAAPAEERSCYMLPLSAKSGEALAALAKSMSARLAQGGAESIHDIAYTASVRRSHHEHRMAVVGRVKEEMAAALESFSRGERPPTTVHGKAPHGARPNIVFVFSGQGSQWVGMGRDLIREEPVFERAITTCDELMRRHAGWSLLEELHRPEETSRLDETEIAQPALFAVEVALAALLASWGVVPDAVIGHSVGEIAAAHLAGALALEEAIRLVVLRGRVMQRSGEGKMVSVTMTAEEARRAIAGREEWLDVAAVNDHASVVLSGDATELDALIAELSLRGVRCRSLRVRFAFHSPAMEPLRAELSAELGSIACGPTSIPLYSTVTGRVVSGEALDTVYWEKNLRHGVLFANAVDEALSQGPQVFLEIGPHPVLTDSIERCIAARGDVGYAFSTLRRNRQERQSMLRSLGALYAQGAVQNLERLYPEGGRVVALPNYPWQRRRYWIEAGARIAGVSTGHPLLGVRMAVAGAGAVFEAELHTRALPFLADHRVHGEVLLPAAALLDMACAAAEAHLRRGPIRITRLLLQTAVVLTGGSALQVQTALSEPADEGATISVYGRPSTAPVDAGWTLHARGHVSVASGAGATDIEGARARCRTELPVADVYRALADRGIHYGPAFRGVRALWRGAGEALSWIELPPEVGDGAGRFGLHPALLDAALQTLHEAFETKDDIFLPFEFGDVVFWKRGATACWVHASVEQPSDGAEIAVGAVTVVDQRGDLVAQISGLQLKRAVEAAVSRRSAAAPSLPLYLPAWHEKAPPASAEDVSGSWLVLRTGETSEELSREVAARLASTGGRCVVVAPDLWPRPGDAGELNAAAASAVAAALAAAPDAAPLRGVVCLWGTRTSGAPAEAAETLAVAGLAVAQALAKRASPPRLFWVTEGARAVRPDDGISLALAPLWALAEVVMQEHPELRCRLIDLEPGAEGSAEALWRELRGGDDEARAAWRSGKRHVARLVAASDRDAAWRPAAVEGTVIITGGLGALGFSVAQWLWDEHRTGHLVLVGRRAPDGDRLRDIEALRARGASVTVAQADVADAADVEGLVASLPADRPLRGIIHAAGALDDGVMMHLDAARFAAVFAPKARGAWNLHEATRHAKLDFFVMFSSIASLLGSVGQGNYAAANGFLDALAHRRRADGLAAHSVHWGAWSGGGMAERLDTAHRSRWTRIGVGFLSPRQALGMLAQAMGRGEPELGAFPLDLDRLRRSLGSDVPPLWRALVTSATSAAPGPGTAQSTWTQATSALPGPARRPEVVSAIRADVARILSLASASEVPEDRPLSELGMDSLMAVELRNALAARVGKALPSTLAFDHPTVDDLARYLLDTALSTERAGAPGAPPVQSRPRDEAVAIIGIGCRYPGAVTDLEGFWRLLDEGVDAIREVPKDRWDIDAYYDPDPGAPGKMITRSGGFLDRVDEFDPGFFGISPREAAKMDPQQRVLLEVTWEALENAGLPTERLSGSDTGVFVGLMYHDYATFVGDALEQLDGYVATGSAGSVASGRISYLLGAKGPSMTVDTACSSSLVTTHLACQSLRTGECSLALAGGVTLMLTPAVHVEFSRLRGLAPDGRCKSFDASADGVSWSEGCGMLVLKRLSDAERDSDPIVAVIRGSAVNQDGRSNGLTAPNGSSQEAVIRRALAQAGVAPADVGYVEAHGTGTQLGDPIEVQALAAVAREGRSADAPLLIGSVKSNFGHTQAAAGVAGVIKAVLSLRRGVTPRTLHFKEPNPMVAWSELPVKVAAEAIAWPGGGKPRIAGVSAFGISGTNAHVVLENAPERAAAAPAEEEPIVLLPLSAKTAEALRAQASAYRDFLRREPSDALSDIAYTAGARRSHHAHRLALVGSSRQELTASLDAFVRGEARAGVAAGATQAGERPRVVFVFPGQGSQWLGMTRELLDREPVFRRAIDACDAAIRRETGWPLLDELTADEGSSRLDQIDVVQPTLFAVAVALSALWRSWGVEPDAVVGHSMGEVAAAHVAGALSLEDAAAIICRRSRLLRRMSGQGAMALVDLSRERAVEALRGHEDRVSVAVSNSPRSTVLSGDPDAIEEILARLEKEKVFWRRVKVDVASHSPQMDPLLDELRAALADIRPAALHIPLCSTVTGESCDGAALTATYWARNLRDPVLFSVAAARLSEGGPTLFLEMSPHPILVPSLEELLRESAPGGAALGSLRRGQEERRALLESAGALFARGYPLDFARLHRDTARCVALPTYPWQRQRYWLDAPGPTSKKRPGVAPGGARRRPLLGAPLTVSTQPKTRFWEQELSTASLPHLADHRLHDDAVLPASAYVEMALSASAGAHGASDVSLVDMAFERLLFVPADVGRKVQVVLGAEEGGRATFQVASLDGDAWVTHATATLQVGGEETAAPDDRGEPPIAIQARCAAKVDAAAHYQRMAALGTPYGKSFQGVDAIWLGDDEALGEVRLPGHLGDGADGHALHHALLDSGFQVLGHLISASSALTANAEPYVPVGIDRVRVHERPSPRLFVHARLRPCADDASERVGDLTFLESDGRVAVAIRGLRAQRLSPGAVRRQSPLDPWLYAVVWRPHALVTPPERTADAGASQPAKSAWLVLTDRTGTGVALTTHLRARGDACIRVVAGKRFARIEPDLYELDPADAAGYRTLLDEAFGDGTRCRGVVSLWSLDATPVEATTERTLRADQRLGCVSALHLANALERAGWRDTPRLWLVTRGAQAVGPEPPTVSVAQAPLWGFARTLMIEQPSLSPTCVDLSPVPSPADVEALWRELLAAGAEDQIALRAGERYVARLARGHRRPGGVSPAPLAGSARVSAEGMYLVTGGLGGLGLSVASWLVAQGARHVALMGRSDPTATARAAIAALERAGAAVVVLKADVSVPQEVESALAALAARGPSLRGVVHAAGVLDDRTVAELDAERLDTVMAPKVQGAWNLHALTRGRPLDFFVMYSSAASLLGSPGQANYAAGNAFLDALAHHRRALGLPALSINWGAFSEVGLAAAQENRGARLAFHGMGSLTPAQGDEVMDRLVASAEVQIAAMALNPRHWIESYPSAARSPFWAELRGEDAAEPASQASVRVREALSRTRPAERRALLEKHVREQVGLVLRLDGARLDRHGALRNLGLDSLMSLEMRNRLESLLDLKLPASLLFSCPTLAALTDHLMGQLGLDDRDAGAQAHGGADAAAAQERLCLEALEQDDLLRLLDEELSLVGNESSE